jgi:hypothetical protein
MGVNKHIIIFPKIKTKGTHITIIGKVEWKKQLANPTGSNTHWVQ